MTRPIFHIGFPKSGSTYLQRQVFPNLPDCNYMGLNNFSADTEDYNLLDGFYLNLCKTDGLSFDVKKAIADKDMILKKSKTASAIFSYEYVVGVLFGYPDAVTKAERLAKVFGKDIKIIMIVREQTDILSSQYRDHPFEPHDIHRGKPVSFDEWYKQTNELRFFRFTDLVRYHRLINVYDELFGRENVLVLPIELMSHDPDFYAQKMGNFLDVDSDIILKNLGRPAVNKGHSAGANRLRRLRRLFPVPLAFSEILPASVYTMLKDIITRGAQEKVEISNKTKADIENRYADANKLLEERIGIDLGPLGYKVAETGDDALMTVESPYGKYTGYKSDRAIVQIQKFGAHTRPELSMVLNFIKEKDTIIDIGAHIGTFSVPIAQAAGSDGKLFCFEANPQTVELLEKNLKDNNLKAQVFNNGVSDKSGQLYIQQRKNKYKSSGSDYLVETSSIDDTPLVEVNLIKIDDAISEKIDFIKIDVEGMEINVLKSAAKTIDKSRPVIYSEYVEGYMKRSGANPKEFAGFFKDRNYHYFINAGARNASNDDFQLVKVPGPQYIRGQVDFLMFPKESDRYPTDFSNWYNFAPIKFLSNRFKNFLKDMNAKWKIKR